MMLKLKFTQNLSILDVMNSGMEMVVFDPKDMLGILDLRSMGYSKIKQGILQHNVSKYYIFESANIDLKDAYHSLRLSDNSKRYF